MADDDKKKEGHIDKIIMGVILGGAIGSVLGLTLAPRKGKETRAILKKKGHEILEKGKEASGQFVRDHREKLESAKFELKKSRKGFLNWLFQKKPKDQTMPRRTLELPDEQDR